MAYSYEDIIRGDFQRIADEQAQAAAELEAGRISEDAYRVQAATKQILQLDLERNALAVRANSFVAGQQAQPQGNPHGLSADEMDIAKASHLTPDEYARNKQRMLRMKAAGEIQSNDQGRVFK